MFHTFFAVPNTLNSCFNTISYFQNFKTSNLQHAKNPKVNIYINTYSKTHKLHKHMFSTNQQLKLFN